MADMPQAIPVPDKPPLHLRGGYLVIAVPEDPVEACFAAPAIRAFRNGRPHATIAVATPASLVPLWEREERIDFIVPYAENASVKMITAALEGTNVEFESSIAWEASKVSKAFAKLKIQQRFGYRLNKLTPQLSDPLDFTQPFGPPAHRVRYYMTLVEKLGVEAMVPANFKTPPLPERPKVPTIAIAPGSEFGPAYRWPLDRFTEVANLLRNSNLDVVVLGQGAAAPEAEELAHRLGPDITYLPESQSLTPVLDTLAGCTALLANDGVLPHFAAHLGLPSTVLFGPGNNDVRRPLGRIHATLNAHSSCSPCSMAKCPLDHRCMNDLTVEQVSAELAKLIVQQP